MINLKHVITLAFFRTFVRVGDWQVVPPHNRGWNEDIPLDVASRRVATLVFDTGDPWGEMYVCDITSDGRVYPYTCIAAHEGIAELFDLVGIPTGTHTCPVDRRLEFSATQSDVGYVP